MIRYVPSLAGSNTLKVDRVRGYLYPDALKSDTDDGYMSIQVSLGTFKVGGFEFRMANELIFALNDVGHSDRAYRQYENLAKNWYFQSSREEMLRHAMIHTIVPAEYRAHTMQDHRILNAIKMQQDPNYLKEK
ncbi:MAG: hypothetical protein H6765_00670 [Candidatus Peribacteria bacterium]|nr:MAG: hypothetical protein H6765_00670 [Candidatus Peribacteria bacterium]